MTQAYKIIRWIVNFLILVNKRRLCLFSNMHFYCFSPIFWWRKQWQPTPVLLPGESHEDGGAWQAVVHRVAESWTHWATSLSLSCIEGGNGNQLQCYCLENPRDGGAWWAAVYGVTQSRTQLKRLSSSIFWNMRGILGPYHIFQITFLLLKMQPTLS